MTGRRFWQMLFLAIPGILSALEISLSSPRDGAAVPLLNHLIDGFRKLPGKDLHEQIENYVLSCGFTHEDIARFRSLMLEKR